MENQKVINLLTNTPNQASKFRTKNWIEIKNDARGTDNKDTQTESKTSIPKSS